MLPQWILHQPINMLCKVLTLGFNLMMVTKRKQQQQQRIALGFFGGFFLSNDHAINRTFYMKSKEMLLKVRESIIRLKNQNKPFKEITKTLDQPK